MARDRALDTMTPCKAPRIGHRAAFALAITVLAACAASCGGGGGGGSAATASTGGSGAGVQASAYFPTDLNNRWLYTDVSSTNGIGPTLVASIGTQSTGSQSGAIVEVSSPSGINATSSIFVNQSDGVWQVPSALSDALSVRIGPIKVIPNPVAAGASYTQVDTTVDSGYDYDGDGKTDPIAIQAVVSVVSVQESQSVPAGVFTDCIHLSTAVTETVHLTGGGTLSAANTEDDWYAPGIGLVHTAQTPSGSSSLVPSAQWLAEYRIAGRHSAAPSITAQTPGSGPSRGATLAVTATFDRLMSTSSVTQAGTLTIKDSSGATVPGTVAMYGNTVNFSPSQSWSTGAYSATVSIAATDLVGNALTANQTWAFVADATSPTIAVATPANGAADVPLDSVIALLMTEPIDPATVIPGTITLVDSSGSSVPGITTLLPDGMTLVYTPSSPLSRRTNYQATVAWSAADMVGNLAQGSILFRTAQGRFAAPVTLGSPAGAVGSVLTDLNQDGYVDVVLGLDTPGTPLAVMYGQPGGTLAAPVSIPGGPAGSFFGGVAVGDVNGDGIPDVVVGADYHGMQVFLQDAQGNLTAGDFLNNAEARAMRIADVDGDGKNELLTVSVLSTKVNIWHQDANGHLQLQQKLDFGYYGGYGLEIGDVNGDGLPDIVVSMSFGVSGKNVAVFLSQGGGNFAAPVFLAADPLWGATGIAIGDVNGDGRNDIVVGTGGNSPTQIGVFYQNADGTMGSYTPLASYDIPDAVRIADINGDGRQDIVVVHDYFNSFGVYLQQADGSLAPEVLYDTGIGVGGGADSFQIADLNHDGAPDILFGATYFVRQNLVPASQVAARARRPAAATTPAIAPVRNAP